MTNRKDLRELSTAGADAANNTPRYNPATGLIEWSPAASWSTIRETLTADANDQILTLGETPRVAETVYLWLDGWLLLPGVDYTVDGADPKIHTLTSALTGGEVLHLSYESTTDPAAPSTLVAAPSTFDPRDIPGLRVWYSAEYEAANYTDGAEVTTLTDLSGNGYHAAPKGGPGWAPSWRSTGGPGGGPRFRVNASTDEGFLLPSAVTSGLTAGEAMQYVKVDSGGAQSHYRFGTAGVAGHLPFSDGLIYDEFGSTSRKDGIAPTAALTSWRRWNVWSAANDWACRLDEVTQHATASNTVAWRSDPVIMKAAGTATPGCDLSVFVLYDHKLTTAERSDLVTWLTANPSGGLP